VEVSAVTAELTAAEDMDEVALGPQRGLCSGTDEAAAPALGCSAGWCMSVANHNTDVACGASQSEFLLQVVLYTSSPGR